MTPQTAIAEFILTLKGRLYMFNPDFETLLSSLQEEKAAALLFIDNLQEVRRILRPLDGKVFNKRIAEHVKAASGEKIYCSIHRNDTAKTFRCWVTCISNHAYDELFNLTVSGRYLSWHIVNEKNRFVFAELDKYLVNRIQSHREKVAAIDRDILDGRQRLEELRQVRRYYIQLVQGFSDKSQQFIEPRITWFGDRAN